MTEEHIEPHVVNRTAEIVKVKQPYIEWANQLLDNSDIVISLDELNMDKFRLPFTPLKSSAT